MTLHTSRLKLEPLQPHHPDAFFAGLRDERLYEFLDEEPPENICALRTRSAHLATGKSPDGRLAWLNWAVWACPEVRYVGYVQATIAEDRSAQIAYLLFRDAWGKGYAEALAAIVAHLGEHRKMATFHATVDPRNDRSIEILTALGFRRVRCRKAAARIRGVCVDESDYLLEVGPLGEIG